MTVPLQEAIVVPENTSFYFGVSQQKMHYSLFIGCKDQNGVDRILLRVGKVGISATPSDLLSMPIQFYTTGVTSALINEGVHPWGRQDDSQVKSLNYVATDISFAQMCDIYRLLRDIRVNKENRKQVKPLLDQFDRSAFLFYTRRLSCEAFMPLYDKESKTITFTKEPIALSAFSAFDHDLPSVMKPSAEAEVKDYEVNYLSIYNHCYTFVLKVLQKVFGENHPSSSYAIFSPPYVLRLRNRQPDVPLYSLPPMPDSFANLDSNRKEALGKIYNRLIEIPKKDAESTETQDKFSELKALYYKMAEQTHVPLATILQQTLSNIDTQQKLYQVRKPGFFSTMLHLQSSTQSLLESMQQSLGNP
jgi:hypothetical protein